MVSTIKTKILKMMNLVTEGSRWMSPNGFMFIVKSIEDNNDGLWVIYTRYNNEKEYSCLLEAFTARFFEYTNTDYE